MEPEVEMEQMQGIGGLMIEPPQTPVQFKDCGTHYELLYTGEFETVGRESADMAKLLRDLKEGDRDMELDILINSPGGDLATLSMVLQQVLQYRRIVTVCCGSALSAGFLLWACGHERYCSPYSEMMFHLAHSGYEGKGFEIQRYGQHVERLTEQIMEAVGVSGLLSKEDIERGRTTEMWYTGEDFIKSGKARDYSEYCDIERPCLVGVLLAGNRFFVKGEGNGYCELVMSGENVTYDDMLAICAQASEDVEAALEAPRKDGKEARRKKKGPADAI